MPEAFVDIVMLFTERTKKVLIHFIVAVSISVTFTLLMYFLTDFGLSNTSIIVAVSYLGYVGLYLVTRAGVFDIFRFQFIQWISSFRPKKRLPYEDAYSYKEKLAEKRSTSKHVFLPWLIVGLVYLILAISTAFYPL